MSKRKISALLAALLLLLGTASLAWAQVSPHYDLSWHVVAAGGNERAASGQYMVHGTVSQFAIGPAAGTTYAVSQGYWYGSYTGGYLYLPLMIKATGP